MTDTVEIQLWVRNEVGPPTFVNTLDFSHPMHPYNQILSQGKRPEAFGYMRPYEFEGKSKSELIAEIMDLRKESVRSLKEGQTNDN